MLELKVRLLRARVEELQQQEAVGGERPLSRDPASLHLPAIAGAVASASTSEYADWTPADDAMAQEFMGVFDCDLLRAAIIAAFCAVLQQWQTQELQETLIKKQQLRAELQVCARRAC
jgi:hypothetical protein